MGRRTRERMIAEFRKLVGLPEGSTGSLPDRKHREAREEEAGEEEDRGENNEAPVVVTREHIGPRVTRRQGPR